MVEHAEVEARATLREAIDSAERAYERLASGKHAGRPAARDKKLKAELRNAVKSLDRVSSELGSKVSKGKRPRIGRGRKVLLVVAGSVVVVGTCPWMRGKVLDALFGAEEEFEYSPPPMPDVSEAPAPTVDAPPAHPAPPSDPAAAVTNATPPADAGTQAAPESAAADVTDASAPTTES